jgi:CII-binding regulator of phage lambda lysogenization HflD
MDTQTIMNFIGASAIAVGGWFAREIWGAVKELRKDLHELEVDLPKSYVSKLDLDKRMEHIETMFQRIYDKIEKVEDKLNEKADR